MARRLGAAAVALAVPLLLIALNVAVLASPPAVRAGLARLPTPPDEPAAARAARGVAAADYVAWRAPDLSGSGLVDPAERAHLADVRRVLGALALLAAAAGAALAAAGRAARGHAERAAALRRALGRGGWLTLGLVAAVGAGIAFGWERTFVLFHALLFPQGNWAFPADSALLALFPEPFWFTAAAVLAAATALEAAALAAWGRGGRRAAGRPAAARADGGAA